MLQQPSFAITACSCVRPVISMENKMGRHKYSKEELIAMLIRWKSIHGEVPSQEQWDKDRDVPSSNPIRSTFGSWAKGIIAAGMEPKKPMASEKSRLAVSLAKRGNRSSAWKGGRYKNEQGYIDIWMPEHPNAKKSRGKKTYILEHRFVMSGHLGRPLERWEHVHHKNGIKHDNRIENLEIVTTKTHLGKVECPHCRKEFFIQ